MHFSLQYALKSQCFTVLGKPTWATRVHQIPVAELATDLTLTPAPDPIKYLTGYDWIVLYSVRGNLRLLY